MLEIADPAGRRQSLADEQVAPGCYAARSSELAPGVYERRVEHHDDAGRGAVANSGFVILVAAEVRRNRADTALRCRIAPLTGGSELQSTAELAALGLRGGDGWKISWPYLYHGRATLVYGRCRCPARSRHNVRDQGATEGPCRIAVRSRSHAASAPACSAVGALTFPS